MVSLLGLCFFRNNSQNQKKNYVFIEGFTITIVEHLQVQLMHTAAFMGNNIESEMELVKGCAKALKEIGFITTNIFGYSFDGAANNKEIHTIDLRLRGCKIIRKEFHINL